MSLCRDTRLLGDSRDRDGEPVVTLVCLLTVGHIDDFHTDGEWHWQDSDFGWAAWKEPVTWG